MSHTLFTTPFTKLIVTGLIFLFVYALEISSVAASSIVVTETVVNRTPVNDQTATLEVTQVAVSPVQADLRFEIGAPVVGDAIVIGQCAVTFVDVAGATTDELDCVDNTASIDLTVGAGDTPRTQSELTATLAQGGLTNATDTAQGALTFERDDDETPEQVLVLGPTSPATTTNITFVVATGTPATFISSTTPVVGLPQEQTLTIGGTVQASDIFTVDIGPERFEYEAPSATTTTAVATALAALISNYDPFGDLFIAPLSHTGNQILFRASTVGDDVNVSATTTDTLAVAQQVRFTPQDVARNYRYRVTLNDVNYDFVSSSNVLTEVVSGLRTAIAAPGITCTDDGVAITCTADVAGVPFTYAASVTSLSRSSSGGGRPRPTPVSAVMPPAGPLATTSPTNQQDVEALRERVREIIILARGRNLTVPPALLRFIGEVPSGRFVRDLMLGNQGDEVRDLQQLLITAASGPRAQALAAVGATGYFGPLTRDALAEYQEREGISPAQGYFGPRTRAHVQARGI